MKAINYLILAFLLFPLGLFAQSSEGKIQALRLKWNDLLVNSNVLEQSNSYVTDYLEDVNDKAKAVWTALVKKPVGTDTRSFLFEDLPMTAKNNTGTSQITFTYDRLRMLTLAYKMPQTDFYKRQDVYDEIIAALDFMVTNFYSVANATPGTNTSASGTYGNWYDWRIGTPLRYNDILMMLSEDLTSEQLQKYMTPVLANNKAVDTTGANKIWIAYIVAQAGILLDRADLIQSAKNGVKSVFSFVAKGTTADGYYEDGSFVQHSNYAYTGGYGKALICTLAPLMYVLKGSDWEITYSDNVQQNFYDMVFQAYEPLIYDGRFMDMVREREISRIANQDHVPGRQVIRAILLLSDVLEGEQQERAHEMLKEWLNDETVLSQVCSDRLDGFLEYTLNTTMLAKALEVVSDENIPLRGKLILHKRYPAMDRVVHLQNDYALGVAMTSTRIKNTEGTNNEGIRLWHIGDGMTYLYNEDKDLFADHFWATVDLQRLPGTTVTRVNRGVKDGYGTHNPYKWTGGTGLDAYGVTGMQFRGMGVTTTRSLEAKKSWFMFDDEIVALGSDITLSGGNAPVETIVENRKILSDFSNDITLNNKVMLRTGGSGPIEDNKALKIATVVSADNTNVLVKYNFLEDIAGVVTFEYDIKLPTAADFMAVKTYGKGANDSQEKLLNFSSMRGGMLAQRLNASGTAQDACSPDAVVNPNTWHRIKLEFNMNAGAYNYYFDGVHISETKVIAGVSYSVAANLTDHSFIQSLSGVNAKLTSFEIITPNKGIGTIILDNLQVKVNDKVVFTEDFESFENGNLSNKNGWVVTQTDLNNGAGAIIFDDPKENAEPVVDEFSALHQEVEWIHLGGSKGEKTDIGYFFPGKTNIQGIRETRIGSWELVNTYFKFIDSTPRTNNFVSFWFNHGDAPENEKYAYVLLPGKSKEETKEYATKPDVEIIEHSSDIHAVREHSLGITSANFWKAGSLGDFTVDAPASLMSREINEGIIELSISDPTQSSSSITLMLDKVLVNEISSDDGVTIDDYNGKCRIRINSSKSVGKTFRCTIKVKDTQVGMQVLNSNQSANVYPNPLERGRKLSVKIDGYNENKENAFLSIYNSLGCKVKEELIENDITEISWESAPGIYFLYYKDVKKKIIVK